MRKYYFALVAALLALSTTTTAQTSKKQRLYTTLQQSNAEAAQAAEPTLPKNVNKFIKLPFPEKSFPVSDVALPLACAAQKRKLQR